MIKFPNLWYFAMENLANKYASLVTVSSQVLT